MTRACLTLALVLAACQPAEEAPNAGPADTPGAAGAVDSTLLQGRVPRAIAGDSGWKYNVSARADFDGDGVEERAVLIADVALDARGTPVWEDGHRWQLYVEEPDSTRTYAYAAFLPNGKATVDVTVADSARPPTMTLLSQTPFALSVYEFAYRSPGTVVVLTRFERTIDPSRVFVGSPRP